MLENLLQLVAEGGVHSYEDLMRRLSVSQPLLEMMLQDLARLGYLRLVGDACGEQCEACPVGCCSATDPGHTWTLTDKGAQAVTRLSS